MKLPVQLTLLPAASRNDLAKTCQLQETKKELKQSDQDYGLNSAELLATYDQGSQSWRTSQHSLVETTGGGLERFLETWPRSGMTRNGTAYRLPNLVRTITEIGSGLLPTPVKSDATTGQIIGKNDTFKMTKNGNLRKYNGKGTNGSLGLARYVKFWPTPCARDYKGARSQESLVAAGRDGTNSLPDAFAVSQKSARLNPRFVEALMGYPDMHTDLKD